MRGLFKALTQEGTRTSQALVNHRLRKNKIS